MYKAESIRERGEPCGVPLEMVKGSEIKSLSFSEACRPVRKDLIQSQRLAGKPLSRKTWVMRPVLTLSKKPEMLKSSNAPTWPTAHVACMQCTRVATASMAMWCIRKSGKYFFYFFLLFLQKSFKKF